MESYIQYASGFSKENVTNSDLINAIDFIKKVDPEHGAFWVSIIKEDENVIEIEQDLSMTVILEQMDPIKYNCKSWEEAKEIFQLLLDGKLSEIKNMLQN